MILGLYVIGSAVALLMLSASLREARDELDRAREEHDAAAQAMRNEYGAYAHGVVVSMACLLAALGAAHWYAPPRPAARPAGDGRDSTPAGAPVKGTYAAPGRDGQWWFWQPSAQGDAVDLEPIAPISAVSVTADAVSRTLTRARILGRQAS